ncbi:MAG: hypothetical protein JOY77_08770 [Alphaproteobacteria bacterium]|nr:hypothetical protein [Alphaproteobacteria bacterium]
MRGDEFEDRPLARFLVAVPVLVFALVAGSIWYLLHGPSAMRREAPPLPTLQAVLPPPPPPPPKPKEKPPEPEKKVEEVQKQTPTPKQLNAPKPLTINGPAQAGTDQFGLGAGDGGGDVAGGSGFGAENYGRYLTSVVQSAIEQNEWLNHLAFNAQVLAWVDDNKRLHLKLLTATGDQRVDAALVNLPSAMPALDEEPPGPGEFKLAIHSRRPA